MASTRNKNTAGDYKLEQLQNTNIVNYDTYAPYGKPEQALFAGDGLIHGRMASEQLSNNSADIESMLFGIGSTNLVHPNAPITPHIKQIKSLSIIDRLPLYLPSDLIITADQRPMRN